MSNHFRTSSRLGDVFLSSSTLADIRKPGVQTPHCAPPCAIHATCSGCRLSGVPRPSIVVIFASGFTLLIGVRQARIAFPSTITVQVPHCPSLQHTLQPVSSSCSRSTSARFFFGSTTKERSRPLTFRVRFSITFSTFLQFKMIVLPLSSPALASLCAGVGMNKDRMRRHLPFASMTISGWRDESATLSHAAVY